MATHGFSDDPNHPQPARTIDDMAPNPMRYQLIDVAFGLAHQNNGNPTEALLHQTIGHCLGVHVSGNPMGHRRTVSASLLIEAEWRRVYDVILRLVPEFHAAGRFPEYRDGVNQVLGANGIAWELDPQGHLVRILPVAVQALVLAAIQELGAQEYAPALGLFNLAQAAYDDIPRRDRDACANAFDTMEAVAKVKHNQPQLTFGQVVAHIAAGHNAEIVRILQRINQLRNGNFGHGLPFTLTPAEVDFTYLTCVAGILFFARTP